MVYLPHGRRAVINSLVTTVPSSYLENLVVVPPRTTFHIFQSCLPTFRPTLVPSSLEIWPLECKHRYIQLVVFITHDRVTTSLYGITCVQAFTYYQSFDTDHQALKLAVSSQYNYPDAILNDMPPNRCYYCGRSVTVSCLPRLNVFAGFSTHSSWLW